MFMAVRCDVCRVVAEAVDTGTICERSGTEVYTVPPGWSSGTWTGVDLCPTCAAAGVDRKGRAT